MNCEDLMFIWKRLKVEKPKGLERSYCVNLGCLEREVIREKFGERSNKGITSYPLFLVGRPMRFLLV